MSRPPLCTALTIPAVTVLLKFIGLPNAITHSPGLRVAELPSFNVGSFSFALILKTAKSAIGSMSIISAL